MQVALFPGQGSQYQGMLENFISEYALVKNIFVQASEVLDQDLLHIIAEDPDLLNQTATTQPVLLASSYALWSLLQDRCDFKPQFVAGHSLGEYSALVCGGACQVFVGSPPALRSRSPETVHQEGQQEGHLLLCR